MRRSVAIRPALVLALVLALAGCTAGRELPDLDLAAAAAGADAPGDGDVLVEGGWPEAAAFVRDAAAAGEATVVNVFASWCAPCEEELPLLLGTAATTADVRWLGIASEDRPQDAAAFVERLDVTWPTLLDRPASVHVALEGIAMPTTAFFDADGELVSVVTGELDEERLAQELARITP